MEVDFALVLPLGHLFRIPSIIVRPEKFGAQGRKRQHDERHEQNGLWLRQRWNSDSVDSLRTIRSRRLRSGEPAARDSGAQVDHRVLDSTTEYLTDDRNPTGYSQVLSETTFDANGAVSKKTIYSVGHDQISQTVYDYSASSQQPTVTTQFFGTDGHGSVRVLVDAVAAIVRDPAFQLQLYTFDAYGNLLGWTNAQPLTSYLYSGESFDFSIGQQYLRARFYDATTGRFNRLDPFFGNSADPQSFHKYGYVHGDPIHGIDPTGMFTVGGMLIGIVRGIVIGGGASLLTSLSVEMLHSSSADNRFGIGGYDATPVLTRLRRDVIAAWNLFSHADKQRVIDTLRKWWDPYTSIIVGWDIKEMKFKYKSLWSGKGFLSLENTLSFRGYVYAVADANYVLWGLLHGLAHRDKVRPLHSALAGTLAPIFAYRLALGGAVYLGTDAKWDSFETIQGKVAWAEFGWAWATNVNTQMNTRAALLHGSPLSEVWPYALNAEVGKMVFSVSTPGPNAPEP